MPYFPPTTGGSTITNWVAYTPTIGGLTINASGVYSRRVGDSLEVQGYISVNGQSASPATIQIGYNGTSGNVSVDYAKLNAGTLIGYACNNNGASVPNGPFSYAIASDNLAGANVVNITWIINGTGALAPENGSAAFSNQNYSFFFKVPISGWTA